MEQNMLSFSCPSYNMLLFCLLVQWHNPPVSTPISQSHSACPTYSGVRLGHLSQVWWHAVIPPPLNMCVLCWICTQVTLLLSVSKDCGSLQEGTVPFLAALTKKMHAQVSWLFRGIFRPLWQQMPRDLRDRESVRSSCASDTPEGGGSSTPRGLYRAHSAGWGLMEEWPRDSPGAISHVSSLFSSPFTSAISTNVKIQGKQTNDFW